MAIWPEFSGLLNTVAGLFWTFAFGGFAIFYGAFLLRLPAAKRIWRRAPMGWFEFALAYVVFLSVAFPCPCGRRSGPGLQARLGASGFTLAYSRPVTCGAGVADSGGRPRRRM